MSNQYYVRRVIAFNGMIDNQIVENYVTHYYNEPNDTWSHDMTLSVAYSDKNEADVSLMMVEDRTHGESSITYQVF